MEHGSDKQKTCFQPAGKYFCEIGKQAQLGGLQIDTERKEHGLGRRPFGPGMLEYRFERRLQNGLGTLEKDSGGWRNGAGRLEDGPGRLENSSGRLQNWSERLEVASEA